MSKKSTELDQEAFEKFVVEGLLRSMDCELIEIPPDECDASNKFHVKRSTDGLRIGEVDGVIRVLADIKVEDIFKYRGETMVRMACRERNSVITRGTVLFIESTVSNGSTVTNGANSYLMKKMNFHKTIQNTEVPLRNDKHNTSCFFESDRSQATMLFIYNGTDNNTVNSVIYDSDNASGLRAIAVWVNKTDVTRWETQIQLAEKQIQLAEKQIQLLTKAREMRIITLVNLLKAQIPNARTFVAELTDDEYDAAMERVSSSSSSSSSA